MTISNRGIMHSKILYNTSITLVIILIMVACENGVDPSSQASIPVLTTADVSGITASSALTGGNIISDGGTEVTARGVCWSINATPTIANNKTTDGTGIGSFISTISDLLENTTYHVRAYATNSVGTGFGNTITFTTSMGSENTVTDIDGNLYQTVRIGNQVWMAENLKTSRLNDGQIIPYITDDTAWGNLNTPGYCFFNNDSGNVDGHGAIYNCYAVDTGKLAPEGWHIPTKTEFETLAAAVNNNSNTLKAVGQGIGSGAGTNTSGFSALLSGCRVGGLYFFNRGLSTYFWSSSEYSAAMAHTMHLFYDDSHINYMPKYKNEGFSVRCIKN